MLFTKNFLLAILSVTSVVASPIAIRDGATVAGDVSSILSKLQSLDTKVNGFNGGIIGGIGFLSAYNSLKSAIEGATGAVQSAGALSLADSTTIVGDLNAVTTEVAIVIKDLIAKAPTVASSGFTSNVHDALGTLKSDCDDFFAAIAGSVDKSMTANVTADATACDNAFTSAIAAY